MAATRTLRYPLHLSSRMLPTDALFWYAEAATPELKLREVARSGEGATLTWWPYPGLTSYRVYRSASPGQWGTFIDVTASDPNAADARFDDPATGTFYYLVTGVGPAGEGPR